MMKIAIRALFEESYHKKFLPRGKLSLFPALIYGILLHFKLFCRKMCVFLRFTLFCRQIGLLQFTRFCVEKILAKNSVRGEKMTNMRYELECISQF